MGIDGQVRRGPPWRWLGWGAAGALLLAPAVAMGLGAEGVLWTPSDFVFAGVMFGVLGGGIELAVAKSASWTYRGGVAIALLASFLLVWAGGAVGIIGSENNDANGLFLGVIGLAFLGSLVARFRAGGLVWAMAAAAVAQAAVGVAALALGWGVEGEAWPRDVIGATVVFTAMWSVSAWLFGVSARNYVPAAS